MKEIRKTLSNTSFNRKKRKKKSVKGSEVKGQGGESKTSGKSIAAGSRQSIVSDATEVREDKNREKARGFVCSKARGTYGRTPLGE